MDRIVAALGQELKRGSLVLGVLSRLEEEKYGYALIKELGDYGLQVDQSTLYPLLKRLEKQGLLESLWNLVESRPRKYYRITDLGREVYCRLQSEYLKMHESMTRLMEV